MFVHFASVSEPNVTVELPVFSTVIRYSTVCPTLAFSFAAV